MEEDSGIKAPVTRLRRRLSVEHSEESKSPGPSTPTKKRGGRLAAKPQLELIDENTPQNSPKKTTRRRSTARDVAEVEEKPVTPSRRSTRIKSNTSILSDTPQAVDSPRAMRALRRNSQIGSDTETSTPVTPARTRRARKDSTTSLDKQVTSASGTPVTPARISRTRKNSASNIDKPAENEEARRTTIINEVIAEEPESNLRKSVASDESSSDKKNYSSPSSPRKSPRLLAKKNKKSTSGYEQNESVIQEPDVNMNISADKSKLDGSISKSGDIKIAVESKHKDVLDRTTQLRLSLSSTNILNNVDEKPNIDKSTSSSLLLIPSAVKTKRHRTKSWTTLSSPSPKEGSFYSDNESTKKKIKSKANIFSIRLEPKDNKKTSQSFKGQEEYSVNNKKKNTQNSESDKSMKESIFNQSNNFSSSTVQSPKPTADNPEGNKENLSEQTSKNSAEYLFQKAPCGSIQSMLFIEDSDTDSLGKTNKNAESTNEDQRVPEVEQVKNNELTKESESSILNIPTENKLFSSLPTTQNNDSCEPMDIDETMPDDVSLNDHSGENKPNVQESAVSITHDKSANKSINKSKRKSSLSNAMTQDHDATDNGNKSTLILSEIKDISTGIRDTSKTSNNSRQVNELLSQSLKEPERGSKILNKNISMSCLTSTPVLQKDDKDLSIQMNTSAITPHNDSKKAITEKKKNIGMMSKRLQQNSSDESTDDDSERNSLVVDEAADVGDDYESGDSQDMEERQYERDHEIVDEGVTLSSDEEVSNDSDYEKDSFVVSSDEEDGDLLSGSGEDLDMSDNELTMSAKSKKKYNERISKQQKKASREIFQARHGVDKTEHSTGSKVAKNNRQRLDSSLLESGDDAVVPPKKKKRMRLESTMDSSATKSDAEEPKSIETVEVQEIRTRKSKRLSDSISLPENDTASKVSISKNQTPSQDESLSEEIGHKNKKKKSKRLSESICNEDIINEKEITAICDTTTTDDPLQLQIKQEPKTPQRDLDISTVHFSVREEIEHVQVNNDVSIMKGNETSDPLQSSMAQDENDENSDENLSISENEEITKNYESMLNQLNEDAKPKNKSANISLNLNNKQKKKPKQPVIDQLNITQTKKLNFKSESNSILKKVAIPNDDDDDDATSDSIDLKLLFSDDSSDSEKRSSAVQNKFDTEGHIISRKRTKDSTKLSINLNTSQIQANDSMSLNTSSKKKNKRKSAQKENTTSDGETLPIFIDTLGTRDEFLNKKESKMENENKINKISVNGSCEVGIESGKSKAIYTDENPSEVSNISLKKNNKLKKVSCVEEDAANEPETNKKSTDHLTKKPETEKIKKADQDKKPAKELSITEAYDKSVTNQKADEDNSGISNKKERKKRKRFSDEVDDLIHKGTIPTTNVPNQMNESLVCNSKKKRKLVQNEDIGENNRKRKEREDDIHDKKSKVLKQNSSEKKQVPRLPTTILEQLEDKPKRLFIGTKTPKVVSTTEFKVEETRIKRNKPSNFLEDSIYLNSDSESQNVKKQKLKYKKPVVLPFTPTVSISDSGFTTKFHITPIPQKIEFVAQRIETSNYKADYLNARRANKIRTHELYKIHRNVKLSKY